VSRSAPYRHFSSKADLLAELALVTLTGLGRSITVGGIQSVSTSRLRGGCLGYVDWAMLHPQHYALVFGTAPVADPSIAMEAAADDGLLALQRLVEADQRAGCFIPGPAREITTVLWTFLHGLAHLSIGGHLHEPRTVDGTTNVVELIDLTLDSWRPR
jgi:AcrR family transcriptional regulator